MWKTRSYLSLLRHLSGFIKLWLFGFGRHFLRCWKETCVNLSSMLLRIYSSVIWARIGLKSGFLLFENWLTFVCFSHKLELFILLIKLVRYSFLIIHHLAPLLDSFQGWILVFFFRFSYFYQVLVHFSFISIKVASSHGQEASFMNGRTPTFI